MARAQTVCPHRALAVIDQDEQDGEGGDDLDEADKAGELVEEGEKTEMLVNFQLNLRYISEWWKQLYGESEGKQGKGILPHSLSFTTDLHSMGQYVQDGERLMFETVVSIAQPNDRVSIPSDEQNLDGINYLLEKSLTDWYHNRL